jgi:type IV secretion system protein VirB9
MSAAADTRIRSLPYDPDHIVQILGKAGIQSTIEFAADERIENIAVGDSNAWQITPNHRASLVFVKPLAPRSRTNMTVVTDRRTYMFDLVAGDKWTTPVYALKFTYRNDKPPEVEAKPGQSAPQLAAAAAPPSPTMVADKLHFDWQSKGYGKLVPSRVFDDGAAVYLSWNRDIPLPAILTVTEDRKEGPLTYRMSGDYIVVSPIPQNMVLRYGNRMAVLWTSRRIVPAPAAPAATPPSDFAQRVAATQVTPSAPLPSQGRAVRLANLTALYSDKLTDGR